MKRSNSLQWISKAFKAIDRVEKDDQNMPAQGEEEWSIKPFSFYDSESDEVSCTEEKTEREKLNEVNSRAKLDRKLSFNSLAELLKNPGTSGRRETNMQSSFDAQLDDTEEVFKPEKLRKSFSMQSLVSASKKALALPLFHSQKETLGDKDLEEMHEIFQDGNFVMIDGLIVLAPQEKRKRHKIKC